MDTQLKLNLTSLNIDQITCALARFIIHFDWNDDEAEFLDWCCNRRKGELVSKSDKDCITRAVICYLDQYAATLELNGFPMPSLPLKGPEIIFDGDAWGLLSRSSLKGRHDPTREELAQEINRCLNASLEVCNEKDEIYESVEHRLNEFACDPDYADYDPGATDVREIAWQEIKARFRVGPAE